jgi:hypothetical protein
MNNITDDVQVIIYRYALTDDDIWNLVIKHKFLPRIIMQVLAFYGTGELCGLSNWLTSQKDLQYDQMIRELLSFYISKKNFKYAKIVMYYVCCNGRIEVAENYLEYFVSEKTGWYLLYACIYTRNVYLADLVIEHFHLVEIVKSRVNYEPCHEILTSVSDTTMQRYMMNKFMICSIGGKT